MNKHLDCEDCKQLREVWHFALSEFAESATRLGDGRNKAKQAKCETDLAWIAAANARTLLDLHRSGRV